MDKKTLDTIILYSRYAQALYSAAAALGGYYELDEECHRLEALAMEYDKKIDDITND